MTTDKIEEIKKNENISCKFEEVGEQDTEGYVAHTQDKVYLVVGDKETLVDTYSLGAYNRSGYFQKNPPLSSEESVDAQINYKDAKPLNPEELPAKVAEYKRLYDENKIAREISCSSDNLYYYSKSLKSDNLIEFDDMKRMIERKAPQLERGDLMFKYMNNPKALKKASDCYHNMISSRDYSRSILFGLDTSKMNSFDDLVTELKKQKEQNDASYNKVNEKLTSVAKGIFDTVCLPEIRKGMLKEVYDHQEIYAKYDISHSTETISKSTQELNEARRRLDNIKKSRQQLDNEDKREKKATQITPQLEGIRQMKAMREAKLVK